LLLNSTIGEVANAPLLQRYHSAGVSQDGLLSADVRLQPERQLANACWQRGRAVAGSELGSRILASVSFSRVANWMNLGVDSCRELQTHLFPYWDAHLYGYRIVSPEKDTRRVIESGQIRCE